MTNQGESTPGASEELNYKASRYNHFFPLEDGDVLSYNAFSNSLAIIPQKNYEIIKQILDQSDISSHEPSEHDRLKTDLIRGGFLIDGKLDEIQILTAQNRIGRFANTVFPLTIAPTLACNFKCTYCFEEMKAHAMTPSVEKALIAFVDSKLRKFKNLQISFFGGEPLLRVDIIERLSRAFDEICKKHNVERNPSSIITNGFLLSKEMADRLVAVKIQTAQITLDGPPEIHNKRRKLLNGNGTFKRILENIKQTADVLNIHVRINIDKENAHKVEEFYDLWEREGLTGKVSFYFGHVVSNTRACADIASQCYTTREYSRLMLELLQKAQNRGISNIRYPLLFKTGFCMADNLNGFVVAPSGHLFKCWEEISADDEDAIGNVLTGEQRTHYIMNNVKYLNWDPFSDEDCKKCGVLPICIGGCAYNGLNNSKSKDCSFWKYNLKDMLLLKHRETKKTNKGG